MLHPALRLSTLALPLGCVFSAAIARADAEETEHVLHPEPKTVFEPLQQGAWGTGLSGSIGRSDEALTARDTSGIDARTRGFRYLVSIRTGYFLVQRFVVGLDFQLSVTSSTTQLSSAGASLAIDNYEERLFLGPWLRYYIPVSSAWAVFPEFSWGFQNRYRTQDSDTSAPGVDAEDRSSGLGFNLGFGFTYFLTRNVAFDVTGRYSRGRLRGRFTNIGASNDLSDVGVLVGFQIYLPEFSF